MRLPRPRTVRTKLTLTTVGVIAAVLLLLSAITDVAARRVLTASIEEDLMDRAEDMSRNMVRDEGNPPFMRGPGDPNEPGRPAPPQGEGFGGPQPNDRRPPRRRDPAFTPPFVARFDGGRIPGPPNDRRPAYDRDAIESARYGAKGFTLASNQDGRIRVYTTPMIKAGKIVGAVQTAYPMEDVYRSFDNLRTILLTVVVPIGIALSALASLFVVDRLLGPLRRLVHDADRIDAAGGEARLAVIGQDEFAGLAGTLNGMLERIDASFRAQEASLDAQRRFTADASHELKTPLAVVKANAGLLLYASDLSQEDREAVAAIDGAAGRMNKLVRDLLTLARADEGGALEHSQPVDLGEVVDRAVAQVPGARDRVRVDRNEPWMVRAIPGDLVRVFVNLIDNALKHSGPEKAVVVRVDGGTVDVVDDGAGIAPEHLPHLFERFYRADEGRSSESGGTGLGLAIVRGIVEAHGGRAEVESTLGKGTRFRVTLPRSDGSE